MKKTAIFTGIGTAIVTPFKDGEIDYPTLGELIERQIAAGVGAIVACGTTGEAATLADGERAELYRRVRNMTRGRVCLILGTGSPDTKRAIAYTRQAKEVGADGVLVVTPYYNKGTKEGIYRHYRAIADEGGMPMILYNVPSRTGVNLDMELVRRLARIPSVAGIKEAADSAERLAELSSLSTRLPLYTGADAMIYTTLALGGAGAISVVSNLYPEDTVEICKQFFARNYREAREIQHGLGGIIKSLFLETNPAPVKYAMARAGLCTPEMRLPMWLPTERCQRRIDRAMDEYEARRRE